jgi:hypothetical protein
MRIEEPNILLMGRKLDKFCALFQQLRQLDLLREANREQKDRQ